MPDIYVGRQPIFNNRLGVYGYELLFRQGKVNSAEMGGLSAHAATSHTLVNSFMEIGLDKLVGKRLAFINLTEQFLFEEDALPIPPQQVVLEVLEDIPVTERLIEAIKQLSKKGFTIALDDYIYNPAHKPLVSLVDIIKIDIMQLTRDELVEHARILGQFKAKLLAEKIETMEEFELCQELGFEYFQGYFLSKPRTIRGNSLPTNKLAVLNLLSILQNPDAGTSELEEAISMDVSISYKILKVINSAFFSFSKKIESIRQAIVVLGRNQLSRWASMLALTSMEDRPSELIKMAMTRGKMCELLAEKAGHKSTDSYYTVGLFSALDILMERELDELIEPLPLSQDVVAALLNKEGPMGEALRCVIAYEVSDFENATFENLEANDLFVANVEAVSWANMVMEVL